MARTHTFLILIFILVKICTVQNSSYTHHAFLDPDRKYQMWWRFDDTHITVEIKVATTGWVAWGLSPDDKMEASDIVIGWINGPNKNLKDMHGNILNPTHDKVNDYKLLMMYERNGATTVKFSRKLYLCSDEDMSITTDTMRIVYAWNDKDPENKTFIIDPTALKRGTKSIYLLDYTNRVNSPLPSHYKTFDLTMSGHAFKAKDTIQWCKTFKLPRMLGKHHLIRIEPNITKGNEKFVHHMVLYQCPDINKSYLGQENECYIKKPVDISECTPIHAWAAGGTTFNFPQEAGLSLNTPNDPKVILLEIHYNNPSLRTDTADSSGFRIYYTRSLRKSDAGILVAGVMEKESLIIPPNQNNFTAYGYCSSKCLNITRDGRRPRIFGSVLHTHRHGKEIVVKLVRDSDGTETKRITQDLNYDFKNQNTRYLSKPVEIPSGYSINIECTYKTTDINDADSAIVSGLGQGSKDEMCVAYLYYYPKMRVRKCLSRSRKFRSFAKKVLSWKFNNSTGRFKNTFMIGKKNFRGKRVFDALKAKGVWKQFFNRRKVRDFEKAGKTSPYYRRCSYGPGSRHANVQNVTTTHIAVKSKLVKTCPKKIVSSGVSSSNTTDNETTGGGGMLHDQLHVIINCFETIIRKMSSWFE